MVRNLIAGYSKIFVENSQTCFRLKQTVSLVILKREAQVNTTS